MKEAPNIWNKMQTPRLQLNLFVQVGSHHEPSLHTESQRGDCLTHSHNNPLPCGLHLRRQHPSRSRRSTTTGPTQ